MPSLEIQIADPTSPEAIALMEELNATMVDLYQPDQNHFDPPEELAKPHVRFVMAFLDNAPVGCGAIKLLPEGYAELKRMYVREAGRGKGIGKAILLELEQMARDADYRVIRLETGVYQSEALGLYRKQGYVEIPAFGEYPNEPVSVYLEKKLPEV